MFLKKVFPVPTTIRAFNNPQNFSHSTVVKQVFNFHINLRIKRLNIILQDYRMVNILFTIKFIQQQITIFKCIWQHIVPCLVCIIRAYSIVRNQDQSPF